MLKCILANLVAKWDVRQLTQSEAAGERGKSGVSYPNTLTPQGREDYTHLETIKLHNYVYCSSQGRVFGYRLASLR